MINFCASRNNTEKHTTQPKQLNTISTSWPWFSRTLWLSVRKRGGPFRGSTKKVEFAPPSKCS